MSVERVSELGDLRVDFQVGLFEYLEQAEDHLVEIFADLEVQFSSSTLG